MSDEGSEHIDMETFLSYFAGALDDARERVVEEHVAGCDRCARQAQGVERFDAAWRLPIGSLIAIKERLLLSETLAAAASGSPTLQDRLLTWARAWSGRAQGALRVVIDASASTARVVAEGIDDLTRPDSGWHFQPIAAAVSVRGGGDRDPSAAVLETPLDPSQPRARVAVRGGAQTEIDVRVDGLGPNELPPLVVLIEHRADDLPRAHVARLEARPGLDCHVARFTGLAAGEYILAVEPLERSS